MEKAQAKVAIVDDHVDTVTSLSNYLEGNGFKTVWAYTEDDALKMMDKENPDFLIINTRLEGSSGFDLSSKFSGVKTIFTTANDKDAAKAAKLKNCIGVVRKPIDQDLIVQILNTEVEL